ncbi:phosphoglycerate dehydrogenase [Daejeonella sp. H1SJ63]|uniref:phosphoglycerate dehydrogenase n=1 Tax=Daejeonella sp. H1SJ63 TaxID=3034145 RepID=UPI0023EACD89|nr:phosphoglycerate dehydrogenase [Daejeonella sp. H1SJ63]
MKILLTSTSFQDTPGNHQVLLENQGFQIDELRGPLKEEVLLDVIDRYDGIICGDDEITRRVIEKGAQGKLKIISKYGIGLDKVDLEAARFFKIPVENCPGVNQITVAEHVFALLLSFVKNIIPENEYVQNQQWERLIGNDIYGKTLGIIGLGSVGKQVAIRAAAFGLKVIAYDTFHDADFAKKHTINYCGNVNELLSQSDIISLNVSLFPETTNMINSSILNILKPGVIVINTARAGLVEQEAILKGIDSKIIKAYLTDVLEEEPMVKDHPFLQYKNIVITPHIGSRTYENVERQGTMAVENLLKYIGK